MTNCKFCKVEYDETDARAAESHTEPVHCNARRTCRCQGKPGCYPCGDSFCLCSSH